VRYAEDPELREITLHGHRLAYRQAGEEGPVLVLIHGITSDSSTWRRVMPYRRAALQRDRARPDRHGGSAKPKGDYSLGGTRASCVNLLVALGHDRASFVGHSLGGGIAMQLSYQFPERCERLALGSTVRPRPRRQPLLRARDAAGSELVVPLLAATRLLTAGRNRRRLLGRLGLRAGTDIGRSHAGTQRSRRRDAVGLRADAALGRRAWRPARQPRQSPVSGRASHCFCCGASTTR